MLESRADDRRQTDGAGGPRQAHALVGDEAERFLDFLERFIEETGRGLGVAEPLREMRILVPLVRDHLQGRTETPSSLISRSGLPRGTAHRMIEDLVARGLIAKRARTRTGKTFTLHPSHALLEAWLDYARRVRSLAGTAFSSGRNDYFFGATYLASSVVPPLDALGERLALKDGLRILLHADPAFMAMQSVKKMLEVHFGTRVQVRALSIDRLHDEIVANTAEPVSRYDIVTCDVCWMAEFLDRGMLAEVTGEAGMGPAEIGDFHPEAIATVRRGDRLYGLPVQTTPELFVWRSDIFEQRGLAPPQTPAEVLALAEELHEPDRGRAGICWNGARGTPVGTTFMMLMADFGQPVLDLPAAGDGFSAVALRPEQHRPVLDGPVALEVAEFLIALSEFSPDNVLQMSWYERALCFAEGRAAMGYCYTQIAQLFENDPSSPAYRRTGYALHPNVRPERRIAPLGGWNLCIPSNLPPERLGEATRAILSLSSAPATKHYIENGSMVSSRFSVCEDPSIAHGHPTIPIVDRMARSDQLKAWPRPAVPELSELVRVLGEEIHMMLLRNKRPREALRDAQARADHLMRRNGRY